MRSILVGMVVAMTIVPAVRPPQAPTLDPAGKWIFSTHDEDGTAIGGTMELTGQPGSYHGTIAIQGIDDKLPVTDVATSTNSVIVLATLPDGGAAVIKIWKGTDGKLQSLWGPVKQIIPATVEKGQ